MKISTVVKFSLLIVAFLFIIGIVGRLDTQDEKQSLAIYCDNVSQNIWPDYKHIYKHDCND